MQRKFTRNWEIHPTLPLAISQISNLKDIPSILIALSRGDEIFVKLNLLLHNSKTKTCHLCNNAFNYNKENGSWTQRKLVQYLNTVVWKLTNSSGLVIPNITSEKWSPFPVVLKPKGTASVCKYNVKKCVLYELCFLRKVLLSFETLWKAEFQQCYWAWNIYYYFLRSYGVYE